LLHIEVLVGLQACCDEAQELGAWLERLGVDAKESSFEILREAVFTVQSLKVSSVVLTGLDVV
jgi:hypothetical protein